MNQIWMDLKDALSFKRISTIIAAILVLAFFVFMWHIGALDKNILHDFFQNVFTNPTFIGWAIGIITGGFAIFKGTSK